MGILSFFGRDAEKVGSRAAKREAKVLAKEAARATAHAKPATRAAIKTGGEMAAAHSVIKPKTIGSRDLTFDPRNIGRKPGRPRDTHALREANKVRTKPSRNKARLYPAPPRQKMLGGSATHYTTNNKHADKIINSKYGMMARKHPYAIGGGIIGATALSNSIGPGRAGSPKGNSSQAKGIYGF